MSAHSNASKRRTRSVTAAEATANDAPQGANTLVANREGNPIHQNVAGDSGQGRGPTNRLIADARNHEAPLESVSTRPRDAAHRSTAPNTGDDSTPAEATTLQDDPTPLLQNGDEGIDLADQLHSRLSSQFSGQHIEFCGCRSWVSPPTSSSKRCESCDSGASWRTASARWYKYSYQTHPPSSVI